MPQLLSKFKTAISKFIWSTPLRWHFPNRVSRMEAIQRAIDTIGAQRYLEIGVESGNCFSTIKATEKIGVDPVPAQPATQRELAKPGVQYFPMESDRFFQEEAARVLSKGVDVVFIDGLHTFAQTYRDCVNSLKHLNQGGVIFVHDCLPANASEATVAASYEEVGKLVGSTWDGYWTGDTWKAITLLRSQHTDVEAFVLDCDKGLGVILKSKGDARLSFVAEEVEKLTYADLAQRKEELIGLRRPRALMAALAKLEESRVKSESF